MIYTISELKEIFEELPLPVRYQVFDAKPPLPFALWRFIESNDMYADDVNYTKISVLELTIVSDKREDEIPGSYKLVGRSQAMTKSIACARTHTHTQTHTQRGNLVDMFRVDGSCSLDIDYNFGG